MSENNELVAELREDVGKGASRRLRRESDKVPAILYGASKDPLMLVFPANVIRKKLEDEAFYSSILKLKVGAKTEQAVLKDIQRHPSKGIVMHMDFLRVTSSDPITMHVPLHFIGEDVAPGVKEGGISSHVMNDIEIKCLPKHLPEFIEVDVSNLGLDQSLHLSDIKLPEGVSLSGGEVDDEHNLPIFSIHTAKAAAVEEPEAPEESEGEAEGGEGSE